LSGINDVTENIGKTVARNIDNVVTFGLANNLNNIGTRRIVSTARQVLGRTALSGVIEGTFDEGTQYMIGEEYQSGKYNGNLDYLNAFYENQRAGWRAVSGLFNPWSELHSNEEFMESAKSGLLLSAFMEGVPLAV
jgi:hypothetical protein